MLHDGWRYARGCIVKGRLLWHGLNTTARRYPFCWAGKPQKTSGRPIWWSFFTTAISAIGSPRVTTVVSHSYTHSREGDPLLHQTQCPRLRLRWRNGRLQHNRWRPVGFCGGDDPVSSWSPPSRPGMMGLLLAARNWLYCSQALVWPRS